MDKKIQVLEIRKIIFILIISYHRIHCNHLDNLEQGKSRQNETELFQNINLFCYIADVEKNNKSLDCLNMLKDVKK